MTEFTIVANLGALPISFAMQPADVERILGPPRFGRYNDVGEREEHWDAVCVHYSNSDGRAAEIGFSPMVRLIYGGVDLFQTEDVIRFLSQFDTPYEFVGFIVFLHLGISMTGFHDGDKSQIAITVFRQGRWDTFRDQLVAFPLTPLNNESVES